MVTHKMTGTPTYRSWFCMKQRCLNPNNHKYESYGGNGIGVCDRWLDFSNFYEDMGVRPEETTLDRIDNAGDYTPENCRWADIQTQNRNRKWIFKNNTSGARGVYYERGDKRVKRWRARVTFNGKKYSAGLYATMEDAEKAWWEKYNELSRRSI